MSNTQVPVPRPPTERRDPPTPNVTRTAQERLPDLKHLLPAWYPKDAFFGDVYAQQLGDNNPNYDQIAARIKDVNAQMDKDPHDNRFYKQEAPIERPDRTASYKPDPRTGIKPRPEDQATYQHVRQQDQRRGSSIGGQFGNGIKPKS